MGVELDDMVSNGSKFSVSDGFGIMLRADVLLLLLDAGMSSSQGGRGEGISHGKCKISCERADFCEKVNSRLQGRCGDLTPECACESEWGAWGTSVWFAANRVIFIMFDRLTTP